MLNDVLNFADLTPEEFAAKIDSDPRLEELLLEALAIAGRTRQPQVRTTLARIAAKGLTDDALVDESHFLTRTMGRLEGPHLTALIAIDTAPRDSMSPEQIAEAYPAATAVIGSIISVLDGENLIEDVASDITVGDFVRHHPRWRVSAFGHMLLARVRGDE